MLKDWEFMDLMFFFPMLKRSSAMAYNYGDFFLHMMALSCLKFPWAFGLCEQRLILFCLFDFKRQLSMYQIYFRHGNKIGELSFNSGTANPIPSSSRVLTHSVF